MTISSNSLILIEGKAGFGKLMLNHTNLIGVVQNQPDNSEPLNIKMPLDQRIDTLLNDDPDYIVTILEEFVIPGNT